MYTLFCVVSSWIAFWSHAMCTLVIMPRDGKMLVVGEASGLISIVEGTSRSILRKMTGHKE